MHSVALTILARAGCVRFCRTKCPLLTAFFFPFLSSTSATFLPKGFIEEDFVKLFWQIVDKAKQKNQSCRQKAKIAKLHLAAIAIGILNALYVIHFIPCIVFYAFHLLKMYYLHYSLCILLYALYSMHCILCIVFYALYSMHCINIARTYTIFFLGCQHFIIII